jgi:hypothetical protein
MTSVQPPRPDQPDPADYAYNLFRNKQRFRRTVLFPTSLTKSDGPSNSPFAPCKLARQASTARRRIRVCGSMASISSMPLPLHRLCKRLWTF